MPNQITITTGTILKTLLLLVGAWLVFYLRDVVLSVLVAIVIASAMEPGVKVFTSWRIPRVLAVLLLYLLFFGAIFSFVFFFVPPLAGDVAAFVSSLPAYLNTLNTTLAYEEYTALFGGVSIPSDITAGQIITQVREGFNLTGLFGSVISTTASIFGGVFSFVIIVIFSFYFTMMETGVDDFLRVIVPKRYRGYAIDLWLRSKYKIGLWMQGQLLLGLIMGVLVYLGLTILGIKYALPLAVLAAFFELIPVFGPIFAAVPAVLLGFVDGGFTMGLFVIALYVILQQFENHLIYPLVVTKVVGVPPLLVILGLIIGAQLAGFLGILLSIPVVATIQELVRDMNYRTSFASED